MIIQHGSGKSSSPSGGGRILSARMGLVAVLRLRRYRYFGLLVSLTYLIIYLFTIQNIAYLPEVDLSRQASIPSLKLAEDWSSKLWRPRAAFIWEPIGAFYLTRHLMVFISVPNMLIGLLLGTLVGLNLAVGFYQVLSQGGWRTFSSIRGLLGAVPSLLTGFACCAPTFVIALSSLAAGLSVGIIAVRPYLVPLSGLVLGVNLLWGAGRVLQGGRCEIEAATNG